MPNLSYYCNMKTILLQVPEYNLAVAKTILAIKRDNPTKTEIVLAEMIRLSENGIIENAETLSDHIEKVCGTTYDNYRTIMHKLTKQGILKRTAGAIILGPELRQKSSTLAIRGFFDEKEPEHPIPGKHNPDIFISNVKTKLTK